MGFYHMLPEQPGHVSCVLADYHYLNDPLAFFAKMTTENDHSLLLESAEIDNKSNLKSILVLKTALKIVCWQQTVTISAISDNGLQVLDFLEQQLSVFGKIKREATQFDLIFPEIDKNIDEEQRLKAINPFQVLRSVLNTLTAIGDPQYAKFLGGILGYDMLATFEELPEVPTKENRCPDYIFYYPELMLITNHETKSSQLASIIFSGEHAQHNSTVLNQFIDSLYKNWHKYQQYELPKIDSFSSNKVTVTPTDEEFKEQVKQLKEHIIAGDIFQVVPSRTFSVPCYNTLQAYAALKRTNPSPYMFYIKDPDFVLFGASPESALKYASNNRQVEVYPVAGTRKRAFNSTGNIDHDLDSRVELELRNDEKERAEHLMLVDLARNDLARICEPGTRYVKELLKVDRYSHVMHLVSRVIGTLRYDLDALHAYQASMNMGTLVGAPKIKAATLIRQTEGKRRGSYGGAVGYLNGVGDMDTCIVIRTAYVHKGTAYIQAGAGVVYDSDPQAEVDESWNKAQAVIKAIEQTH